MDSGLVFTLVVGTIIVGVFVYHSRHGAFGAPKRGKPTDVVLARRGGVKTSLTVHALAPSDPERGPHVGVEITRTSWGSMEFESISLSKAEALELAKALNRAADSRSSG